MKKMQGRVLVGKLPPAGVPLAVAEVFGTQLAVLEHRILIKGGKRLASGFIKTRATTKP